jgi:hypothetical protein
MPRLEKRNAELKAAARHCAAGSATPICARCSAVPALPKAATTADTTMRKRRALVLATSAL